MDELKATISKNLVELRTKAHLTQLQLAKMLNYSDKAVSKWERGEAIPDLRVLIQLTEIYGITLDDLVKRDGVAPVIQPKRRIIGKHAFITALSVVLVWIVATVVFTIFYLIPATKDYAYLSFIVAPLPMAIVLTVFSALWGNRITNAISTSLIVWACVLVLHIFTVAFTGFTAIVWFYLVAAVLEIAIILWFTYRWYISRKSK